MVSAPPKPKPERDPSKCDGCDDKGCKNDIMYCDVPDANRNAGRG